MNVRGEPKTSTEIFVIWDAPEKDDWNGNLLGYYVGYQLLNSFPTGDISPTPDFNFKTVEIRSHFGGEFLLQNLNKFAQYTIVVQAYTSQGSGPASKEILVATLEDVPSQPPESPKCDVLSSTSIYITWSPPPAEAQNGIIKGYKVAYISSDDLFGKPNLKLVHSLHFLICIVLSNRVTSALCEIFKPVLDHRKSEKVYELQCVGIGLD